LRNQVFEFDSVGSRHRIEAETAVATDSCMSYKPLWQQDIVAERGVELEQAVALYQAVSQRHDAILNSHIIFFESPDNSPELSG
jgi:hypothetical protein